MRSFGSDVFLKLMTAQKILKSVVVVGVAYAKDHQSVRARSRKWNPNAARSDWFYYLGTPPDPDRHARPRRLAGEIRRAIL